MPKQPSSQQQLLLELEDLRARLNEAEETLRAIRNGEVDALIVSGASGEQVFTLTGADHPYRMLIEDMQEGAMTLTRDGIILYANRSLAGMLKTPLEKVIGSTLHDWTAPDNEGILHSLMQTDAVKKRREELILIARDGSPVPVYLSVSQLSLDKLGDCFSVVAMDMTERKRLEEASRQSDAMFRNIFENSPLGKSLTGVDGTLRVNSAFCNILGYSEIELHAKNWKEITHPDDVQKSLDVIQSLMAGERSSVHFEKRYIHKNGNIIWADVTTALQRDESRKPLYFLTTISDITERKHADEEIRILNTELEKRVQERTAKLESANKELEAFSYSVSHDLRAPLRAIDGFSRILLEKHANRLDPEGTRYFQLVRDNARQMGQLVDDLLAFSRLGRQALKKEKVSPLVLFSRAMEELRAEQEGRQVVFKVGELVECEADPILLKQVCINLLSNALKFTGKRAVAHIEVGCIERDGEIAYFVKDNGTGFDMRYANKLFGVFQRLHRVEDFEGTGVGLAIVHRIVHRHGGRVWAEAELDQGATFYFTI